jgi:hypothetical protein
MNMNLDNNEDIHSFKDSNLNLSEENNISKKAVGVDIEYLETIEGQNFNNKNYNNNNNYLNFQINNDFNIFNNIEKKSDFINNVNTEDLKRIYIIENIKFTIENFVEIFQKKFEKIKFFNFLELKEKLKEIKLNKIKAEIIYGKFRNLFMNCIRIKKKFLRNKQIKFFNFWKDQLKMNTKLNEKINNLQKNIENKYKKELSTIEDKYKEKENLNREIKKNIQKNMEIENGIKKTLNEFEEKEKNYTKNIQKLEEEKKNLQEEIDFINQDNEKTNSIINSFNNNNNKIQFSSINLSYEDSTKMNNDSKNDINTFLSVNQGNYKREYILKLDQKVKEYEKKLINLKEEISEKDQKIGVFMNDMSDILLFHEKNSKLNQIIFF